MTIDGIDMNDFWDHVLQVRDPAWHPPTNDQVERLTTEVRHIAEELAEQIWVRAPEVDRMTLVSPDRVRAEAADRALATLRTLREVRDAVDRLAAQAAHQAGSRGAGYPQIGAAWGITRQAARQRWPCAAQHHKIATEHHKG